MKKTLTLFRPHLGVPCRTSLGALLALLLLPLAPSAQTVTTASSTDGRTPAGLQPGAPAGSYSLGGFDTINPFGGGLSFRLPLLKVGGRGSAGYTIVLAVERKWRVEHTTVDPNLYCPSCETYQVTHAYAPTDAPWNSEEPGYTPGVLHGRHAGEEPGPCNGLRAYARTLTRLTFTAADGTEYELRDRLHGGKPLTPSSCAGRQSRGKVFVTADGSAATFVSDEDILDRSAAGDYSPFTPSGVLLLRDGTRYRIDGGRVSWIQDRNGNRTTFTAEGVVDSLGRRVTISHAQFPATPYDEIAYKGFGGAARRVRVYYGSLSANLRAGYAVLTYQSLFAALDGSSSAPYDPPVVSSVELADGRRYKFSYNSYGELARVELPTGGAYEYDHQEWDGALSLGSHDTDRLSSVDEYEIHRRAVRKRVYAAGGALESTTEIAAGAAGPNSTRAEVRQYDAAGRLLAATRHYYHGTPDPVLAQYTKPAQYSAWDEGREYRTEALKADGGVEALRRSERVWEQRSSVGWWNPSYGPEPANDPRVAQATQTLADTNQVSKQSFAYDQYNNQTDVWEYDYGAGAPGPFLRRTHTDFVTAPAYVGADPDPSAGAHMRSLPWRTWVSSDAAGNAKASLTLYEYDNYSPDARHAPLVPRPGITGHDSSYSPSFAARGNPTGVTSYADAAAQAGAVTTSTQYDVAGSVVKSIDPRGHVSTVTYSDSFWGGTYTPNTYAFASSAATPAPDPSGQHGSAAPLVTSSVYDFWTGLVRSTTDPNGKTTSYEYDDPLDRLTAVVRPHGAGRTDYEYGDAAGDLYLRTLTDLDGSRRTEVRLYFDGLGRPVRSFTREGQDPAKPWLTADTEYDALGRAWRSSPPYRSAGAGSAVNPSGRWAETEFDALGRVRAVTTRPDGAAVVNAYGGNGVTVTDQAGRQRRSVSDALGRLKEVTEAPEVSGCQADGAGCTTFYTYDVLGNLRKAEQGGQLRFFMHDSLSRLVRAKNPEQDASAALATSPDPVTGNNQWSLAFGYDANGSLQQRTDARGVTATYSYDALGRNTYVSYSDSTPHVKRVYDGAVNGLGRPHGDWTLSAQGTHYTHGAVDAYDAAGRPLSRRQHFYSGNVAGPAFSAGYVYDLAGNVTSQTYPSGRSVSYDYDAAGRPSSFAGDLGGGAARGYAAETRYHELGGREQERLGTQTPVYDKRFYNSRGQLADIRVSTYPITAAGHETNWDRGAILNHYSQALWGGSDQQNNGNLKFQQVWVPAGDDAGGFALFTQTYSYDRLNRLKKVQEGSHWQQSYTYDRWNNRLIDAAETFGGVPEPQFSAGASNNRLGVPAGQPGQILYDPAGNMTLDTYNGGLGGGGARAYDAEGRMTSAQFLDGQTQTASYSYDAGGRRVRRQLGAGGEVWQVYGAGGELLAEYAAGSQPSGPLKEYGYRSGELLVVAEAAAAGAPQRANVAASSRGATATAQSYTPDGAYPGLHFQPAYANDGVRHISPDGGSYWRDAQGAPSWVQVEFPAPKTVDEVVVYTVADYPAYTAQSDPPPAQTFTQYGVTAFEVQYWTGSAWAAVQGGGVSANNLVRRQLTFPAVTTSKVRVRVTGSADGVVRVAEVEAYEAAAGGQQGPSEVAWQNAVGVSGSGGGLTKTAGAGFNAGASSAQSVVSGDGYVEFTVPLASSDVLCGLSAGDSGQSEADIDFAIYASAYHGSVIVTEGGANRGSFGGWSAGDRFRVAVEGGAVKYYRVAPGGALTLFHTSAATPQYPLVADTSLHWTGDRLTNVVLGGAAGAAGAGPAEVKWLVADHLGTPRMVLDQTGSLAGVSRHDYLPFGTELTAGAGGRTTAQGYGRPGRVRQRFTGQERDDETGLDYFGARYYSGGQGRFTSVDPIMLAADRLLDPQRLNLYTYCRNNPLKYVDPDGEKLVLANSTARARARGNIDKSLASRAERENFTIRGGQVLYEPKNKITNPSTAYTRLVAVITANEVHRYYGVEYNKSASSSGTPHGGVPGTRMTFTHDGLVKTGGASVPYANGDMDHFVPASNAMTVRGEDGAGNIPFPEFRSWFHEVLAHEPITSFTPEAFASNNETAVSVENTIAAELGLPLRDPTGSDHDPWNVTVMGTPETIIISTPQGPLGTEVNLQPPAPVPRPPQ